MKKAIREFFGVFSPKIDLIKWDYDGFDWISTCKHYRITTIDNGPHKGRFHIWYSEKDNQYYTPIDLDDPMTYECVCLAKDMVELHANRVADEHERQVLGIK